MLCAKTVAAATTALMLGAGPAAMGQTVAIPGLVGTGLDANGVGLAAGQTDSRFQLASGPITGPAGVVNSGSFPLINGIWTANLPNGRWIAPLSTVSSNGPTSSAPVGEYVYRMTFDLTGFDHRTASFAGRWSSDNNGLGVYLNGVLLSGSSNNTERAFATLTDFSASGGFVSGVNTLEFRLSNLFNGTANNSNPSGLLVAFDSSAVTIPAPGGAASMLLLGLVALRRSRGSRGAGARGA